MLNKILARFGYHNTSSELARLLTSPSLREEFLGVKEAQLPSAEQIIDDANALSAYASTGEYKVFAKEVWARSLSHIDAVVDPNTTGEKLQFHRGALRASLDLLRLSYLARATRAQVEKQKQPQE